MQELEGKILMRVNNLNENHNGFQYKDGLNILNEEFQPYGSCCPGGLYFTTSEHIYRFKNYGCWIRIVKLPTDDPDFRCVKDPEGYKWRANKLILCEKFPIFCDDLCKKYGINFRLCYSKFLEIEELFGMAKIYKEYTITQLFDKASSFIIYPKCKEIYSTIYNIMSGHVHESLRKCLDIVNELDEGQEKEEYINVYNIIISVIFLLDINSVFISPKIHSKITKYQLIKALTIYKKIDKSYICQGVSNDEDFFSENIKLVDIFCNYFPNMGIEKFGYFEDYFGLVHDNPSGLFILDDILGESHKKIDFDKCDYKNITSDIIRTYFDNCYKSICEDNIKNILELMRNNQHMITPSSLISIIKYLNHSDYNRNLIFDVYRLAEEYGTKIEYDCYILLDILIHRWENSCRLFYNDRCKLYDNKFKYFMDHIPDADMKYLLDELFSRISNEIYVAYHDEMNYSYNSADYPYYNINLDKYSVNIMEIISIRPECVSDQYIQSLFEKFAKILQNKSTIPGFILVYTLKLNNLLASRSSNIKICPDLIPSLFSNITLIHLLDETFYKMLSNFEFDIISKKIESLHCSEKNYIIESVSNNLILYNPTIVRNNIKYLVTIILQNDCRVSCLKKIIRFANKNNLEYNLEYDATGIFFKYIINNISKYGKKNIQELITLSSFNNVEIEAIIPFVLPKFGTVLTTKILKKYAESCANSKKINCEEIIIKNLRSIKIVEIARNEPFLKIGCEYVISLYLKNNPNIDDKTLEEMCSVLILNGNVKLLEMVKSITNKIIISKDTADNILKYKQYSKKASFEEKMKFIKMGNIGSSVKWFDSNKSSIIIC